MERQNRMRKWKKKQGKEKKNVYQELEEMDVIENEGMTKKMDLKES